MLKHHSSFIMNIDLEKCIICNKNYKFQKNSFDYFGNKCVIKNHMILIITIDNKVTVLQLWFPDIEKNVDFVFHLTNKKFTTYMMESQNYYFDPDILNLNKLKEKLKTILLFK